MSCERVLWHKSCRGDIYTFVTSFPSQKNWKHESVFCRGRGTFFILTVIQGLFLSSYAAKYTENDYWYGIALSLYCPSMILVALPCVTQTTQNKGKP